MTEQDLVDAGYKLYTGGAAKLKCADRYYAKMMTDDIGKKFQMVIYVYDYTGREPDWPKVSFMPDVQFNSDDTGRCVDITLHNRPEYTIESIELYYDTLWTFHGKPYYEKWGQ